MTKQEIELLLNMTGKINTIANWKGWMTTTLEYLVTNGYVSRELHLGGSIVYRPSAEGVRKADEIIKQHIELLIGGEKQDKEPSQEK